MSKRVLLLLISVMLFSFSFSLQAEDQATGEKNTNWGFIFNTSSILLDVESYQAGLGAKILFPGNLALRFLVDGFYSSSTDTFSASLGLALEKHVRPGRVSPYLGGVLEAGIMRQLDEIDEDYWTKNISVPFSAGAILGVEFFIVETVSLFAEYNVVFEASVLKTTTSVAGEITESDPEFSYTIDTGIGNEAKLGIVIYLDDVIAIDRK